MSRRLPVGIVTLAVAFTMSTAAAQPPGMVLIPGGEFEMGRHVGSGDSDELPLHDVYVDSFYMDIYEVTNSAYCTYLNSANSQGLIEVRDGGVVYPMGGSDPYCDTHEYGDHHSRIHWDGDTFTITADKEDHPMLQVSWYGAAAYANWRSAQDGRDLCYNLSTWECDFDANGYRLPTEAEWEYACRGGEHEPYYRYPWGDDLDGSMANYWMSGDPYETGDQPWTTPVGYYDGGQTPPGSDMANGYGLYDVVGNVWEWCNDWYGETYYDSSPYDNPQGPASGTDRVVRGNCWGAGPSQARCADRGAAPPNTRYFNDGFRLALAGEQPIPTVSEWGLIIISLLLLAAGMLVFRRRRPAKA